MITPIFHIHQSNTHIFINIISKYIKTTDLDYTIEVHSFIFYCNPYFLKLAFNEKLSVEPTEKVTFDNNTSTFLFSIEKANIDEHFKNLDMLTHFLNPKKAEEIIPGKIEIISSIGPPEELFETSWNHLNCNSVNETSITITPTYGFIGRYMDIHITHASDFNELFETPTLFILPNDKRIPLIHAIELNHFNPEHYLADFFEDSCIKEFIITPVSYERMHRFSEPESQILINLTNKEYAMTPRDIQSSLIAMVDILLAYSYDVRISEKEHTVESAWNIVTLSSTLSCNRIFKSIDECIISFFRRSLSFPLYRNYNLSLKIGDDLKALLKLGKMNILRCLLKIYSIFNSTERYYLVNEMFIKDFLIWIQKIPDNSTLFISFLQNAEQINFPQKKDLDLDLEYYETSAQKIIAEHSDLKPVYPHKTN